MYPYIVTFLLTLLYFEIYQVHTTLHCNKDIIADCRTCLFIFLQIKVLPSFEERKIDDKVKDYIEKSKNFHRHDLNKEESDNQTDNAKNR